MKTQIFLCRWRGFNFRYKPVDSVQIQRERQDKVSSLMKKYFFLDFVSLVLSIKENVLCSLLSFQERTLEEHKKLVEKIMKRDKKRRKRIEAAGIDYECPEIVSFLPLLICDCLGVFIVHVLNFSNVMCNCCCRWVTSSLLQRE